MLLLRVVIPLVYPQRRSEATLLSRGRVYPEPYRGRGLSKWLMQVIVAHPDLQGLRRWLLFTRDAHGLYNQVGFTSLATPERAMEIFFPDIYTRQSV